MKQKKVICENVKNTSFIIREFNILKILLYILLLSTFIWFTSIYSILICSTNEYILLQDVERHSYYIKKSFYICNKFTYKYSIHKYKRYQVLNTENCSVYYVCNTSSPLNAHKKYGENILKTINAIIEYECDYIFQKTVNMKINKNELVFGYIESVCKLLKYVDIEIIEIKKHVNMEYVYESVSTL